MTLIKKSLATLLTCMIFFMMIPSTIAFAATNGWVKSGGYKYYYIDGYRLKDYWVQDKGKYYYLDPDDGHMWTNSLVYYSYYVGKDGSLQYNKWILYDSEDGYNAWLYAGKDGVLYTGWHKMNGKWYYFYRNSDNAFAPFAVNGTAEKIDGTWYVFNSDCSLAKNKWVKEVSSVYWHEWEGDDIEYLYADSKGHAAVGWKKISKKWYYFDEKDNCMMVRGFKKIDGKRYYFKSSGAMQTVGWFNLGTKSNPKWYYANKDGSLLIGGWYIGNDRYYFDSNGLMARNKWVGNYYYGSDGRCTNG